MIDEIRMTRPDFILNSLIGPSSYTFLAAYRALGQEDPHFRADRCPVLSCNLTECELPASLARASMSTSICPPSNPLTACGHFA